MSFQAALRAWSVNLGMPSNFEPVLLRTTVSAEIDRALTKAVQLSGLSKASFVRTAVANHLASLGLLDSTVGEDLPVTRTSGQLKAVRNLKKGTS